MVSFTVLDSTENTAGSTGRQLSALCIKYPVIAQGVLIWAKELASGSEFITTAGYPTVSPCILSLARLISIYHPLARNGVLDLALVFLGHSNSDISHQKMQSIKVCLFRWNCCFVALIDLRNSLPNDVSSNVTNIIGAMPTSPSLYLIPGALTRCNIGSPKQATKRWFLRNRLGSHSLLHLRSSRYSPTTSLTAICPFVVFVLIGRTVCRCIIAI